jgi:hypothetical protein
MEQPRCSACGGDLFIRYSPFHGKSTLPICDPCFIVWYDADEDIDPTDPKQVGALSLKCKRLGKYPWTGEYDLRSEYGPFEPKETQ